MLNKWTTFQNTVPTLPTVQFRHWVTPVRFSAPHLPLFSTGSLQAVQCSSQSQAPVPPRLPRASGGGAGGGAGQEEGLIR